MLKLKPLHVLSSDEPGTVRVHPLVYATDDTAHILTQLPEEERELAVSQLRKIASMIERAAKAIGIDPPVLLLPHGKQANRYAASRAYNSTLFDEPFYVEEVNPHSAAIIIDPRFINGLGCLCVNAQVRPGLRHTDEELYGTIAHEVGHASNYYLEYLNVPKHDRSDGVSILGIRFGAHDNISDIEAIKRYNHSIEHQMDGLALKAGASRTAQLSSIVKMVTDLREQAFHNTSGDHEARVKARAAASHYPMKTGKSTHPSLPDRDKAMRLRETDLEGWKEWVRANRRALSERSK